MAMRGVVEKIPGRVFFCSKADLHTVTQLKSAERLFLLLSKAEPISLPNNPELNNFCLVCKNLLGQTNTPHCQVMRSSQELQCIQQRGQKRKREEDEEDSLHTPSFRVSCRCSGVIARSHTSQVRIIGMAIKEDLGWKVDLRDVCGIFRHPLASRTYMKHNGLHSTIAWAMTSLCPKKVRSRMTFKEANAHTQ
uniref:Uncharacterized protein n=1 Tax=Cyprinus carpio TaxID=7962 RepID=A0A8C1XLB9_CYPCA